MIQWYEGEIISYNDPATDADPVLRATVRELTQGIEIRNVQMPLRSGQQDRPAPGSKIAFYRDTAATAKFGFLLSDPTPIGSPISIETASKAAEDGELVFEDGEVALSALGSDDGFDVTEGGILWLRNNGDAILTSGSYQQRITASDATDSVDIEGSNIDIYAHGNLISTHFLNIDTQSLTGITSLALGLRNPVTGVYVTRLKCDQFGTFTIGAEDPALGSLVSGLSYNLVPSLPGPLIVPEVKLMATPLLSQIVVNPLGTTINGATVTLAGTATVGGASAPATLVSVLSTTTNIGPGSFNVAGVTTLNGATTVNGATTINGATSIVGNTTITGAFQTIANTINLVGVIIPPPALLAAAGATGMIPILVNGVPKNLVLV